MRISSNVCSVYTMKSAICSVLHYSDLFFLFPPVEMIFYGAPKILQAKILGIHLKR